jgi:hypothetical protein
MDLPDVCCKNCLWLAITEKKNRFKDKEYVCLISGGNMPQRQTELDRNKYYFTLPGGRKCKCEFKSKCNKD